MSQSIGHVKPRFGEDFSADPKPVRPADDAFRRVVVIGGGVAGLMSSWILPDHGYKVTIVSRDWASYTKAQRLTSQISGALWEFPSVLCGSRISEADIERVRS